MRTFLIALAFSAMLFGQEEYSVLLNTPANVPTSLLVMVKGSQTAGVATQATVKVPSGVTGTPTRNVVFQLTNDCPSGHVYTSSGANGVSLSASCWPAPAPVPTSISGWWMLSATLTDAERLAVIAAGNKVAVQIVAQPVDVLLPVIVVAFP
jgi:hypothetical protein